MSPLPSETERDRDNPMGTGFLERILRPLSLTDMLEKDGWRNEKLRTDRVDAIVVTAGRVGRGLYGAVKRSETF